MRNKIEGVLTIVLQVILIGAWVVLAIVSFRWLWHGATALKLEYKQQKEEQKALRKEIKKKKAELKKEAKEEK